jgi:hypothetical protein
MIAPLAVRWLLTAVFAAAGGLAAALRRHEPAGAARPADRDFCARCARL